MKIILNPVIVFILCFIGFSAGCGVVMNGIGFVTPSGDVTEPVGATLRIECYVEQNHSEIERGDSSKLVWRKNSVWLSNENIRVLDDYRAELIIFNATESDSGNYKCLLDRGGDKKNPRLVCHNQVFIGTPPIEIKDFSCIAPNWEYLKCTFTPPPTYVKTMYNLTYRPDSRFARNHSPCNLTKEKEKLACNFTASSSETPYLQMAKKFSFILTAQNKLGTKSMEFSVDHYSRVLPNKPSHIVVTNPNSTCLNISWEVGKDIKHLPGGLMFRLRYRSQWDQEDDWKVLQPNRSESLLCGLQPFTQCDVEVQSRSSLATDEDMWSENGTATATTLANVPSVPPTVTLGSFQERTRLDNRTLVVFWKMISNYQKNGQDFRYKVTATSLDSASTRILPHYITDNFAEFYNLKLETAYKFDVYSANEKGLSQFASSIVVEKKSLMPQHPDSFTAIYFGHGVYELSWQPAKHSVSSLSNYTLFWCSNIKPQPFRCNGNMSWIVMGPNVKAHNITLRDDVANYHFAIASNSPEASSGMVWATCIVPYNGTLNRLKKITADSFDSKSIKVQWKLDCAERIGIVTGFKVYYCPLEAHDTSASCHSAQEVKLVNGSYNEETVLIGLKPFMFYKVTVTALTRAGEGEQSKPLSIRTKEGRPGYGGDNFIMANVSNTSITMAWTPPYPSNGLLTKFTIRFDDRTQDIPVTEQLQVYKTTLENLTSYTSYSLELAACTAVGCSNWTKPIYEKTDIGAPGPMMRPQITRMNMSYALVSFEDPIYPNGPIDYRELLVTWETDDERNETSWFTPLNETEVMVPTHCDNPKVQEALFSYSVRAVNVKGSEVLEGPFSESFTFTCFATDGPSMIIIISAVGGTMLITLLIILGVYGYLRCKRTVKEIQSIDIHIPRGLDNDGVKPRIVMPHRPLQETNSGTTTNPTTQELLNRLNGKNNTGGSPRSRNTSGDTRISSSSMDELLQHAPESHHNDSDSNSGPASVSSAQTTRSNLSSDCGNEQDSLLPSTPDSVFTDCPLGVNSSRNSNPPKIEEVPEPSSSHGTPAQYSKFAHYLGGSDGYLPTTGSTSAQAQDSGYVLPMSHNAMQRPEEPMAVAPYSQLDINNGVYINMPTNGNTRAPAYSRVGLAADENLDFNLDNVPAPNEGYRNSGSNLNPVVAFSSCNSKPDFVLSLPDSMLNGHMSNSYSDSEDGSDFTGKSNYDHQPTAALSGYVPNYPDADLNSRQLPIRNPAASKTPPAQGSKQPEKLAKDPVPLVTKNGYVSVSAALDMPSTSSQRNAVGGFPDPKTPPEDDYSSPGPYSRVASMVFDDPPELSKQPQT